MKALWSALLAGLIPFAVFAASGYTVQWQGSLRAVHSGDVSPQVSLKSLAEKPHLYALGPMAGLAGEVTVFDGQFYLTQVQAGQLKTQTEADASASFLVWAEVVEWQSLKLGKTVNSQSELEKRVEVLAATAGVDISQPFPFLLAGVLKSVDYHVVVPPGHGAGSSASHGDHPFKRHQPMSHQMAAPKFSKKQFNGQILGFFSRQHAGVFTHHDQAVHLHVLDEQGHTGHVEMLMLTADTVVHFPQVR